MGEITDVELGLKITEDIGRGDTGAPTKTPLERQEEFREINEQELRRLQGVYIEAADNITGPDKPALYNYPAYFEHRAGILAAMCAIDAKLITLPGVSMLKDSFRHYFLNKLIPMGHDMDAIVPSAMHSNNETMLAYQRALHDILLEFNNSLAHRNYEERLSVSDVRARAQQFAELSAVLREEVGNRGLRPLQRWASKNWKEMVKEGVVYDRNKQVGDVVHILGQRVKLGSGIPARLESEVKSILNQVDDLKSIGEMISVYHGVTLEVPQLRGREENREIIRSKVVSVLREGLHLLPNSLTDGAKDAASFTLRDGGYVLVLRLPRDSLEKGNEFDGVFDYSPRKDFYPDLQGGKVLVPPQLINRIVKT